MSEPERALVIMPTYNERENIERIVPEVLEQDPRISILIVDDSSPDGTGEIAGRLAEENARINVLHREKKEGLGRAYLAGFNWAIEREFDYIFEMDADFSHRPDYLPKFLTEIESADLILGSRYVGGVNVINWPMTRLLLSYFANIYARSVTGINIMDSTGGFKCFRRSVLEAIDLDQVQASGYAFQIEMTFRALQMGFRVREIPIIFYDRTAGDSKMSRNIMWEAIWAVWMLRYKAIINQL